MSTTLSMWLGIAFVLLGVTAVVLQAWLWNPKFWDEVTKKTRAPRAWLRVHRSVGYAFAVIYVLMMWHMVPRLWEYQVELPARTVIHAVAAIILGVLLVTKISILKWFRHFEESMPALGLAILICTVVIGSLSLPFAARGHGFGAPDLDEDNRDRVRKVLARMETEPALDADALTTTQALSRGREVLVTQCVRCHDMRTILAKPRTGNGWYRVIDRMTEKPSVFGEPISPEDVPYVTAYMIAITPRIQESSKGKAETEEQKGALLRKLVGGAFGTTGVPLPTATTEEDPDSMPTQAPAPKPAAEGSAALSPEEGQAMLEKLCTDCHELDEVQAHGGDTAKGWAIVIRQMVDEGAEIEEDQARALVQFLSATYPKAAG